MTRYRVIKTVDIIGDEEFLVIPEPSWAELDSIDNSDMPFWFDSAIAWDANDFTNIEIYQSVETIIVEV
jgi:hypothetical protein